MNKETIPQKIDKNNFDEVLKKILEIPPPKKKKPKKKKN